ncbi:MAG: secondary thiamine-phosphate synthase enzyme YjbQ [Candidatus Methylopumilus sp.]
MELVVRYLLIGIGVLWLADHVPDGDSLFIHTAEGEDDMPAHIRTALTQTSLSIPIKQGKVALGQWQGIFLYEHRYQSHERRILMHAIGE